MGKQSTRTERVTATPISLKPWKTDWEDVEAIALHPRSVVRNTSEILRHAIRFGLPEAKRRLISNGKKVAA